MVEPWEKVVMRILFKLEKLFITNFIKDTFEYYYIHNNTPYTFLDTLPM